MLNGALVTRELLAEVFRLDTFFLFHHISPTSNSNSRAYRTSKSCGMCAKISSSSDNPSNQQSGAGSMGPSTNKAGTAQTTPMTTSNFMSRVSGGAGTTKRDAVKDKKEQLRISPWRRAWEVVNWTPPNCRWDPKKPPQFSMSSTLFFLCLCITINLSLFFFS